MQFEILCSHVVHLILGKFISFGFQFSLNESDENLKNKKDIFEEKLKNGHSIKAAFPSFSGKKKISFHTEFSNTKFLNSPTVLKQFNNETLKQFSVNKIIVKKKIFQIF